MNNIIILEDFIDLEYSTFLENLLMGADFPVYMNSVTVQPYKLGTFKDKNTIEGIQFVHTFVNYGDHNNPYLQHVLPIHLKLCGHLKKDYNLFRCKINVNVPYPGFDGTQYYTPHMDLPESHTITAIYYINDSDGDTIFFDENHNIIQRITPKKGTLVYFRSNMYHAGQPPNISKVRGVLNFNLIPV